MLSWEKNERVRGSASLSIHIALMSVAVSGFKYVCVQDRALKLYPAVA